MARTIQVVSVAAVLGLIVSYPAHAQDGGAQSVADVIVTARLRPESLQTVPLAVSAIEADRIGDLRPVQLSDLSGAAPNFAIDRLNGLDTVMIRGAGGGGRNIGFDAR